MSGWPRFAAQKKRALLERTSDEKQNPPARAGSFKFRYPLHYVKQSVPSTTHDKKRSKRRGAPLPGIVAAMKSKTRRAKGGFVLAPDPAPYIDKANLLSSPRSGQHPLTELVKVVAPQRVLWVAVNVVACRCQRCQP
jgi:hypothetical protein